MVQKSFILLDKMGLHARPAAMLVSKLGSCDSQVDISCQGQNVDGKHIMEILGLRGLAGDEITFTIQGPDEERVMEEVIQVLTSMGTARI